MKQLKFLIVAFTLLMGVSLTSCLKSDDNSNKPYAHFVRVAEGTTVDGYQRHFEDYIGNKLYPTNASLLQVEAASNFKMGTTHFAYIQYKAVESEKKTKTGTETAKSLDINLLSAVTCDGPEPLMAKNKADMERLAVENAPILSLNYGSGFAPFLFDKKTLFLPIYYKMENKTEQVPQHKHRLVCNLEDITSGITDLVFYVRHDRGTDEKTEAINVAHNGYDISAVVEHFVEVTGAEPKNIIVKVKETGENLTTMPEEYTTYTGEFKPAAPINKTN